MSHSYTMNLTHFESTSHSFFKSKVESSADYNIVSKIDDDHVL